MRRLGFTGCALALGAVGAACSSETRLIITVDKSQTPDVDEVRLYVGAGELRRATIGPAKNPNDSQREMFDGTYIALDKAEADDRQAFGASLQRSFALEPGDGSIDAVTVIAVGFQQSDPIAFAIGHDLTIVDGQVRLTDLVLDMEDASRVLRVWGPQAGQHDCAMVRIGDAPATFVIKDANDIDCDGFTNNDPLECEELVHLASRGAAKGGVDDLAPHTRVVLQPGNLPTCEVATTAKGCTDGISNADDATTFDPHFCASLEVCNIQSCGPGELFGCVAPEPIRCDVLYSSTAAGQGGLCGGPIPLTPVDEWLAPFMCSTDAKVVVAGPPPFEWRTEVDAAGVRYRLVTNGCTVTIEPTGVPNVSLLSGPLRTFVAIQIDDAPDGEGVVLPLSLNLVNIGTDDCPPTPPGCSYSSVHAPVTVQALKACLGSP